MGGWRQRVELRGLVPLELRVLELLQLGGSSLLNLVEVQERQQLFDPGPIEFGPLGRRAGLEAAAGVTPGDTLDLTHQQLLAEHRGVTAGREPRRDHAAGLSLGRYVRGWEGCLRRSR